jgi:hypothetical protein
MLQCGPLEQQNLCELIKSMRGGAVAARRAHNPKVPGSNPGPATEENETVDEKSAVFLLTKIKVPNTKNHTCGLIPDIAVFELSKC